MKILIKVLRLLAVIVIAILLFLAIFPNSFESLELIGVNFSKSLNNSVKVVRTEQETNPCLGQRLNRSSDPTAAKNETTDANPSSSKASDDQPKVLVNRDPAVFDVVCQGDTIRFNVYAENVDRVLISIDNSISELGGLTIRNPAQFKNFVEYEVPQDWIGNSSVTATGFVNGKAMIATSKATFMVLNDETGAPATEQTSSSPNRSQTAWSEVTITDGNATIKVGQVLIVDDNTIRLGRLKLTVPQLQLGSKLTLSANNSVVSRVYLTPAKTEAFEALESVEGNVTLGDRIDDLLPVSFEFSANNPGDTEHLVKVSGRANARYLDKTLRSAR